jgi:hypothetical protein
MKAEIKNIVAAVCGVAALTVVAMLTANIGTPRASADAAKPTFKVVKTDAEWRKQLTDEQYRVTRQADTEPAFQNAYYNNHKAGRSRSTTPEPAGRASGRPSSRA